jgi:ABC-2 type transport system ATP-binding protein
MNPLRAYGKLLAQGTAEEVVASQHLTSWAIFGDNLVELQETLRRQPGVDQTVSFGTVLHVSGTDAALLQRAIEETVAGEGVRAEKIDTGLEDVFIYMMSRSADNFGGET